MTEPSISGLRNNMSERERDTEGGKMGWRSVFSSTSALIYSFSLFFFLYGILSRS